MSDRPDDILELILSYEELEPNERARADAVLAESPEYRHLLARLRDVEGATGPEGLLPPIEESPVTTLAPEERAEAERSLEALRSRLAVEEPEVDPGGPAVASPGGLLAWFRRPWLVRLAPVAVAAAVVVAVLRMGPGGVGAVASFDIERAAGVRGIETAPERTGWHSGDAFVLHIRATESFYAVVINLNGSGFPSLLSPDTPSARPSHVTAGSALRLPTPGSGEDWLLSGDPGRETFLLAASPRPDPDLHHVLAQLVRLAGEVRDRGTLVEAVIAILEQSIGPTRRVDIDHLP